MKLVVPKVGDLLTRPVKGAPFLSHYGIYLGFFGTRAWVLDIKKKIGAAWACVRLVPYERFCRHGDVQVEMGPPDMNPSAIRVRALELWARAWVRYSLINLGDGVNCEAVARWVQTGKGRQSRQVEFGMASMLVGLGLVALVAAASDEPA